jgi:hypothetical protein
MNPIVITITAQPGGQVEVSGPLAQPMLCVSILGHALQAVAQHAEQANKAGKLVLPPANGNLDQMLRRGQG